MSLVHWYEAAEARWAHLPAGPHRERLVGATLREIREEAELVAVRLPELDENERVALLQEAVLDAHQRFGMPLTDIAEELFHVRVDDVFARLCVVAREQKAEPHVRGQLIARRLARRWTA